MKKQELLKHLDKFVDDATEEGQSIEPEIIVAIDWLRGSLSREETREARRAQSWDSEPGGKAL